MDITKLSDDKLKALAFDALIVIEQQQNNLKILKAEMQHRQKPMENETVSMPNQVLEENAPNFAVEIPAEETTATETIQETSEPLPEPSVIA